jgi:hypothetical protein
MIAGRKMMIYDEVSLSIDTQLSRCGGDVTVAQSNLPLTLKYLHGTTAHQQC